MTVKADAISWSADKAQWAKSEDCDFCKKRKGAYVTEFSINWKSPSYSTQFDACSCQNLVSCEPCYNEMREAFADGKVTVRARDLDNPRDSSTVEIQQAITERSEGEHE